MQRADARLASATPGERLEIEGIRGFVNGDPGAASRNFSELTRTLPAEPEAWYFAAIAARSIGKVTEGRELASKGLALDSAFVPNTMELAGSYGLSEPVDFVKAKEYAVLAQRRWPNVPQVYIALGSAERVAGHLDAAVAAYSRMIELDSANSLAWGVRANAKMFLGQYAEARADRDRAIRLSPASERTTLVMEDALQFVLEGRVDDALSALRDYELAMGGLHLPAEENDRTGVLANAMLIASFTDRADTAARLARDFSTAVRVVGTKAKTSTVQRIADAAAINADGRVLVAKGDLAGARRKADEEERIRQPDTDPTKLNGAHAVRMLAALKGKDWPTVLREADAGDIPAGSSMIAAYARARALEELGKKAEAKVAYEKILAQRFNNPENTLVYPLAKVRIAGLK